MLFREKHCKKVYASLPNCYTAPRRALYIELHRLVNKPSNGQNASYVTTSQQTQRYSILHTSPQN